MRYTHEDFCNRLVELGIKHKPIEEYQDSYKRIKLQCSENSNHIFSIIPNSISRGKAKCPYCNRRLVFVGETDMWTENKELASMLFNKDDGYKYMSTSSAYVDWVCPNCGQIIKNKRINDVRTYGLSCPYCSDGISYPEKFISNLLNQLDVNFIHDKTLEWSNNKRYDFYIPNISLIIECHGMQHYSNKKNFSKFTSHDLEYETNNDDYKYNLAISNGIKNYVELDCRYSTLDYIKTSILNSELNILFDLSNIDWNTINKKSLSSKVVEICDLWNSGIKDSCKIKDITKYDMCTVINYLKKGAEIGLCDYVPYYNRKKNKEENIKNILELWNDGIKDKKEISKILAISYFCVLSLVKLCKEKDLIDENDIVYNKSNQSKKVLCVETNKIYDSIASVKNDNYSPSSISLCCNNKQEIAYGLHWRFI